MQLLKQNVAFEDCMLRLPNHNMRLLNRTMRSKTEYFLLRRRRYQTECSVLASHVVFTSYTKYGNLGGALRDSYMEISRAVAMYGMKLWAARRLTLSQVTVSIPRMIGSIGPLPPTPPPHTHLMGNIINNTWERNTIVKRNVWFTNTTLYLQIAIFYFFRRVLCFAS